MTPLFPRHGASAIMSALGCGLGLLCSTLPATAQTTDTAPTLGHVPDPATVQPDAKGRHLAPHDTFYVLSYVSATTDSGVDGFVPGQEVHLVSVNRPAHTLVVTDGKAQVEVPASKLTNDLDVAAQARQKDVANQGRVAAYVQAEEAAYAKHEREEAASAAKEDQREKQTQVAQAQATQAQAAQAQAASPTGGQPVDASYGGDGYYGSGGYGYGSPYSYFIGGVNNVTTGGSGPGGGRGTLPSDNAGMSGRANTAPVGAGGERGGAATSGGGGGHAGGGGKP